jgi:hypothetical protein
MNTIKRICQEADVLCAECKQGEVDFYLIDGKVVFEKDFIHYSYCRDVMMRAYLKYCGMDVEKYYRTVFNTLEKELR